MRRFDRFPRQTGTLAAGFTALMLPLSAAQAFPASLQAVLDCQRVTSDQARLACYDRAAATLGQHALATPTFKSTSNAMPDFDPAKPFHQQPSPAEPPERVTVPLLDVADGDGKPVFHLANDQTWRAQTDEFVYIDPKKRNTVTIKKSLLGLGYLLMINNSDREISVKRIR